MTGSTVPVGDGTPDQPAVAADPSPRYLAAAPRGRPLEAVRASIRFRRLVPTGLALAVIDAVQRLAFRLLPSHRAEGRRIVEAVVGGSVPEPELDAYALEHLASRARSAELLWRIHATKRFSATGIDRLRAAQATGRGVLLSYNHMNPVYAWPLMLAARMDRLSYVHGDFLLDELEPGAWAYRVAQMRRALVTSEVELIQATGARPRIVSALEQGRGVFNAFDAPGTSVLPFLGKPVELASGSARLALQTGALIAPLSMVPDGRRYAGVVGEIVDPAEHPTIESLQARLAELHEELILRAPAHLEDPLSRGWPHADRHGWRRTA